MDAAFINCVKTTQANKVLLILDGHCSHKSIDTIDLARANGVVIICLPPHKTHRMQPLDQIVRSSEEILQPRMRTLDA